MQDDIGDGVQFNQAEHAARMVGYPPQGLHEFHFEFENWHGLWIKTGNADPLSTTTPRPCHRSGVPAKSSRLGKKNNGSFFLRKK